MSHTCYQNIAHSWWNSWIKTSTTPQRSALALNSIIIMPKWKMNLLYNQEIIIQVFLRLYVAQESIHFTAIKYRYEPYIESEVQNIYILLIAFELFTHKYGGRSTQERRRTHSGGGQGHGVRYQDTEHSRTHSAPPTSVCHLGRHFTSWVRRKRIHGTIP